MIALVMITLSVGYLTFVAVCLYAAVISSSPICGRLNPASMSLRAKKNHNSGWLSFPLYNVSLVALIQVALSNIHVQYDCSIKYRLGNYTHKMENNNTT